MGKNQVSLHRVFTAKPGKVFRALTDPIATAAWLPPYGFLCQVDEMDVRVGGKFRMSFINFTSGSKQSFRGEYLEIKPNEYIRYEDEFDDPNLPGGINTAMWLTEVSCGTELRVLQENIPDVIPIEMCYLGWQDTLDKLKRLVEPEIPD
ncbi:MAG: SRPBCC family protein [Arcticibacter sp.]